MSREKEREGWSIGEVCLYFNMLTRGTSIRLSSLVLLPYSAATGLSCIPVTVWKCFCGAVCVVFHIFSVYYLGFVCQLFLVLDVQICYIACLSHITIAFYYTIRPCIHVVTRYL